MTDEPADAAPVLAIEALLWFVSRCPPVDETWTDCDHFTVGGWIVLSLLAVPPALVLTTIVFTLVRLLGKK